MEKEKVIVKAVNIDEQHYDKEISTGMRIVDKIYDLTYKKMDALAAKELDTKIQSELERMSRKLQRSVPFAVAAMEVLLREGYYKEPVIVEKELVSDLSELAIYDQLTGLYKRSVFDRLLDVEMKKHKRFGKSLTIAMIDIDDFKKVNDEFGHTTGDEVLTNMGEILSDMSRLYDIECRYGGEEIAVILPETGLESGLEFIERVRLTIQSFFENKPYKVTVSVGIAMMKEKDTPKTLIDAADKALYEAKRNGKNQCVLKKR